MATVLVLTDVEQEGAETRGYTCWLGRDPAWRREGFVIRTLRKLGHTVHLRGLYDRLDLIDRFIADRRIDVIFNLCEAFRGDRAGEAGVAAYWELRGIPFTGNGSLALALGRQKHLVQAIAARAGVAVPRSQVVAARRPKIDWGALTFPVFVKPVDRDASEGISGRSRVATPAAAARRVAQLHRELGCDVLVEEFVPGRDVAVPVLGGREPRCFPPREWFFDRVKRPELMFATFRSKWDEDYRKRLGIRNGPARVVDVARLWDLARTAYAALGFQGCARFDFRMRASDDLPFLIEANPNPSLDPWDDVVRGARMAGMADTELVACILRDTRRGRA